MELSPMPGTGWKQDWVWEGTELKCSTKTSVGPVGGCEARMALHMFQDGMRGEACRPPTSASHWTWAVPGEVMLQRREPL